MTTKGAVNRWASKPHHIFKPGDVVDQRYAVLRVVAVGGMAEVYEALDKRTGDRVAVKTLNLKYADNPRVAARLVREANALRDLRHANLVAVLDAGTHEGQFYIVMVLLEGFTLEELANQQPLPVGVVLSLVRGLTLGVHGLHKVGTIHRDLKLANVFVLEEPGAEEHRPVVLDLGVAKIADASTTGEGLTFGTASYMAPEQTVGARVDARTDVYAICLMTFELLTGVHPMGIGDRPKTAQEWMTRQRQMEAPRLEQIAPHLDPVLGSLLAKGLAKDPDGRFENAHALAQQIAAVMRALCRAGALGPVRLDPFAPQREPDDRKESGPQPVHRIRPPGVPTPSAGLALRRTDQDLSPPVPAARELTKEAKPDAKAASKVAAMGPALVEDPTRKARRGTNRMVGPRGTLVEPPPAKSSRISRRSPVRKAEAKWQDVPPDHAELELEGDEAVSMRASSAHSRERGVASAPASNRFAGLTASAWWRAVLLGVVMSIAGLLVAAWVVQRSPRDVTPTASASAQSTGPFAASAAAAPSIAPAMSAAAEGTSETSAVAAGSAGPAKPQAWRGVPSANAARTAVASEAPPAPSAPPPQPQPSTSARGDELMFPVRREPTAPAPRSSGVELPFPMKEEP